MDRLSELVFAVGEFAPLSARALVGFEKAAEARFSLNPCRSDRWRCPEVPEASSGQRCIRKLMQLHSETNVRNLWFLNPEIVNF